MQDKLKVLMRAKNMNLSQIAQDSGVNISRLSQYLSKKSDLRSESLIKVLKALGIDIERTVSKSIFAEVEKRQPIQSDDTAADDLYAVFAALPRIEKKTILETLISKSALYSMDQGDAPSVDKLKDLRNRISTAI